jgi:nitroreductase
VVRRYGSAVPTGEQLGFGEVAARRRMVRSFSGRQLAPGVADRIVHRAASAPSAGNTGGWATVVLEGPGQTAPFWEATTTESWRSQSRRWPGLSRAPVVVVLFADPAAYLARYSAPDKAGSGLQIADAWPIPYWFVDAGMAIMLLLLAAVEAGLGACFLGNFRGEADLRLALGVPGHLRYVGAVLVGEPAGEDPPSTSTARGGRRVDDVVHRGAWDSHPGGEKADGA